MNFDFSSDLDKLTRNLTNLQKQQIPFATTVAINKLIIGMKDYEQAVLPAEVDKPAPFTMRAFRYNKANKNTLKGEMFIAELQDNYLRFLIDGGTRKPKRKAIAVPDDKVKKNQYGNLPRNTINKMLSNKKKYFSGSPNGRPAGIYEKIKIGNNISIKKVIVWGRKAEYKKQFHFYEHGERYLKEHGLKEFKKALDKVLSDM